MAIGTRVEWLGTGLLGTVEMIGHNAEIAAVRFSDGKLIAIGVIGLAVA